MQYYDRNLRGKSCQIIGFLNRLVSCSQYINLFAFKEFRIASSTVCHTVSHKFFFSRNPQLSRAGTQIQDYTAGLKVPSSLCADNKKILFLFNRRGCSPLQLHGGMTGCMFPEPLHQVLAAVHHSTGIIADFIGIVDPPAIASLFQKKGFPFGSACIYSSRKTGRTAAHDDQIIN